MALTKDDLHNLDEAIATGELTVKMDGREITYRSIAELLRARNHVCKVLAQQAGIKRKNLSCFSINVDRGIR